MERTEKVLRLKTRKGKFLNVVREHYLRDDIACHSELCSQCKKGSGSLLTSDVTHYIVPDTEVTKAYLELFELPEIQGIIFFQTVINHIQYHGGKKLHSRLKKLTTDNRQQCTVFSNEFCKGVYVPREAGEPVENWQQRCIYTGALWYYNHLEQRMPIIVITNDQEAVEKYSNLTIGLFVMDVGDYLHTFWPDYMSLHELYNSLREVHEESKTKSGDGHPTEFSEYLPLEVLEAGIKSGLYFKGCLNVNKHNAQTEAFVPKSSGVSGSKESAVSDILIHGMAHRNRAVHGDIVVAELLPKSEWKGKTVALTNREGVQGVDLEETSEALPTARVVGVLQRNWRDYVASFAEDEETQGQRKRGQKVLVIPWDYRIPKIRVNSHQVDSLRDHRIVVRIDFWEESSVYPSGHFVRSLGPIGNLETETAALMVENSLFAPPFTEAIQKELPGDTPDCPWTMSEEEVKNRRDLRQSHLIFSIDPKGCEDVDDALSVRVMKRGRLELGVHIADVSYFVKPGSLTDSEARARSTTVYLADRRYDMLPEVLSANLCSLIGGKDRFAVSVLWILDEDFNVLKVWFGRTVIRSSYKMTYEAAQTIADGVISQAELVKDIPELHSLEESLVAEKLSELKGTIQRLMVIARHLKAKRTSDGALELDSAEVQVELDDKRDVKTLTPKKALEVHETIAECMIFANHWVAKKIAESFRTAALLRRHPMPREQYFTNLIHCAEAKGFIINTSSNKALADSLDHCTDSTDPTVNKLLRSLATQAMSNALYFSTGSTTEDLFFHYGLALDKYTHFTSPIRRYADVIVHRLLMASVGSAARDHLLDNEELEELCHHINSKHRAAQQAQRDSLELFQTLYFQDLPDGDERRYADGVIFSLRTNGVLVYIPRYGIKGPVYFKSKSGDVVMPLATGEDGVTFGPGSLSRFDFHISITNPAGTFDFNLFDHIKVCIGVAKSRAHAQSLSLELVSMVTVHCPSPDQQGVTDDGHKVKRNQLIQEVVDREDQQRLSDSNSGQPDRDFKKLNLEYGQTHEAVSLYSLFEHFRELSLMEDT